MSHWVTREHKHAGGLREAAHGTCSPHIAGERGANTTEARAQVVALSAAPHLPDPFRLCLAPSPGLRVSPGDSLELCPLLPVLSPLPLTERGWGKRGKRSLHWLSAHTACQTKTKPQVQVLT